MAHKTYALYFMILTVIFVIIAILAAFSGNFDAALGCLAAATAVIALNRTSVLEIEIKKLRAQLANVNQATPEVTTKTWENPTLQ